jgi:hypothetical protein
VNNAQNTYNVFLFVPRTSLIVLESVKSRVREGGGCSHRGRTWQYQMPVGMEDRICGNNRNKTDFYIVRIKYRDRKRYKERSCTCAGTRRTGGDELCCS